MEVGAHCLYNVLRSLIITDEYWNSTAATCHPAAERTDEVFQPTLSLTHFTRLSSRSLKSLKLEDFLWEYWSARAQRNR